MLQTLPNELPPHDYMLTNMMADLRAGKATTVKAVETLSMDATDVLLLRLKDPCDRRLVLNVRAGL